MSTYNYHVLVNISKPQELEIWVATCGLCKKYGQYKYIRQEKCPILTKGG